VAFVRFTESGRSFSPRASLSRYGMLGFNDGARKRFHMDEYKFVVLYYDADIRRIGIELTNDADAPGARRIRFRKTGADVAARSFVDFFGIATQDTTLFPMEIDLITGFVAIDLDCGKARRRRKREKQVGDGEPDSS